MRGGTVEGSGQAGFFETSLCWAQGLYYLLTGAWPLISIETFQFVTGKKTDHLVTGREGDHWLVNTVGVLVCAIAITLIVNALFRRSAFQVRVLAIASAVALTAIDVIYVWRGVISPVYLIDAVAEILLLLGWARVLFTGTTLTSSTGS